MDRKDFLLVVVAAAGGKLLTPVQLQKALFLFDRSGLSEIPRPFYDFRAYHYGPFSTDIYRDADNLQMEGFISRYPSANGAWTETMIAPQGAERAAALEAELPEQVRQYIREVVTWVQSQSFSSLVLRIYEMYTEYRENSVLLG